MTVEQSVLQQHCEKQHQQSLLKQLREITGSTDVCLLQQALQVSNGDLSEAVAFLTERNSEPPQQNEATYYQTAQIGNDRHVSMGSQAHTNVIDLTGDDKEDLQRAIALSLEESSRTFQETGITDEEQAISRVLEASIAENKANLMPSHVEVWSDPRNPHDRKRQENCPVGLKNVGNTCWFSAVIQSLFHLLEFQRLVLQYSPPAQTHDLPRNQKEPRNLPFMQELRHLFSLMVGSKRRYVDPSRAVEILKGAFKSSDSQQQQDVSEFSHKLLDWLEDAFQMKAEEEREGEQPKNPMVELFYGRFVAVGVVEGKKFENTETFGQYPLQVNGYKDLHESLEAAMIEGEIESLHSEKPAVSGQEHWFVELPPVLTFELSRFQFNQALGRAEKIHNKLEFPAVLYLDRYLDRNRDITRVKRQEMKRLKEHLMLLQQRLERYLSYGSGPKKCPLADVLEYTMEFASSQPTLSSLVRHTDAASTQPGGTTAPPQPTPSVADQNPPSSSDGPAGVPFSQQRVLVHKPLTQSRVLPNNLGHPAPRHITEEELRVLEACLQRWRSEVEKDTRELQRCISRIQTTMELMYSEQALMQVPYRLHAVLVHEGQASAGHYWAYIFSPELRLWLKFNDVSVTKSTWEELVRDSFGGYRNASAYCLMYVDDKKPFLIQEEFDKETGQVLSGLDKLPVDLKEYVNKDNWLFEKELLEWDALQAHRATVEKLASAMAAATTASKSAQPGRAQPCPPESTTCQQEPQYMEASPAGDQERRREDTERALSQATAKQEQCSPEGLLNALPSKSPSSTLLPKVLVDQAFKMDTALQPKNKDSISSLPVDKHVVEGSTTCRTADKFRVETTVTPFSVDRPMLGGPNVPILSIQVGVNKKNTTEIFVQGVVKGSTPSGSHGEPMVDSQPRLQHGTANGSITVNARAHTVVEGVNCQSPHDKPMADGLTAPPHPVKLVAESTGGPPSPFQVVSEGIEVLPLSIKHVVEGSEAAPPPIKQVAESTEALPSPFHVVSEGTEAPPLSVNPIVEGSETPPPPVKPVAENTKVPPPPFQVVSEGNEVPFPSVKPTVEGCEAPPLHAKLVTEVSEAPPPPFKSMTEGMEAPPPLVRPVTDGNKVLALLGEDTAECPKAPPPPVLREIHAFTTPSDPVHPMTEGSQAPPTPDKPETVVCRAPSPSVQPTALFCKAPPLPVQSMPKGFAAPSPPAQRVGNGAVAHVGTTTQSQESSYDDDEAMLTPSMQSVIRAIGKAWSVYDKCGPEAAFFKAIKVEYARLLWLAREDTSHEKDPRLLYVMVYLIKNQAPKKILEKTLLTQFADSSLSFNERCKNIMKVAQEKLLLIRPDEVNLEEYEAWHQDYQTFRETTVFLMIGLELFQKESYVEALMYLIYSYQYNKKLLSKGPYRGHDKELIAHYRRECLLRLNKHAAALFQSGEEPELSDGLTIMNELVVPCLSLLLAEEEERDTAAVEDIRNRWCSYLGQEMEPKLQETLTDFLPKLLDCSAETRSFRDPPRLPSLSALELCERFSQILTSLGHSPAKER